MKRYTLVIMFGLMCMSDLCAQERLPVGSHPPALEFEHFPDRAHAVVWRNWDLVEPARIAKTLGCDVSDVTAIASSMGLGPAKPLSAAFRKQIYITIIRRNWHLLPYDQLLTLLDMSEEALSFALKEDDFLYHKLGRLKPACSPVRYEKPGHNAVARAKAIRKLVRHHFENARSTPSEPMFSFIDDLASVENPPDQSRKINNGEGLRFIYSYFGVFGDPLMDAKVDPYPDGLLSKLASNGINGIWMHVVLNQLAPGGKTFPEFGEGHETRLASLRRIAERARKYGIRIYLYMNEPRAMPLSFFEDRPGMKGTSGGGFVAMCTSNSDVRDWLRNSLTHVFKNVPDLGGVFTITASENFTNCASHGNQKGCPRCSIRDYADIIAEVNTTIAEGVHGGNPHAKVIVWDWGWHGHGDAPDIISKLPKSVWLMSVSEWSTPIERGGISSKVGEYSISAVGPGPRAQRHWALAKEAGLRTVAKVQFNCTWELSAVPWIPAMDLVANHASSLARTDIDGVMLSWTLGGYPSTNLAIAQKFAEDPGADIDRVLNTLAEQRYGAQAAPLIRKAWTAFSNAFLNYPYHIGVVYRGPQQYGPANLLYAKPTGYSATMVGLPYDDLGGWRSIYPADVYISLLRKVADGWKDGLSDFHKAVALADDKDVALSDLGVAKAAYLHFASSANQARFVMVRDSLMRHDLPGETRMKLLKEANSIIDNEIDLARQLYAVTQRDSRIGFEATNQYYYVRQDLIEKVVNCEYVRTALNGL